MDKIKMSLDFEMTINDIVDLNKSFSIGKCLIAYAGVNRNDKIISKETFTEALPSLKNIPIVGHYIEEINDFGGHDMRLKKNDDGTLSIVNDTVPFGVIPESAQQWWETQIIDGKEKECLFTDILLWKRQNGYKKIKDTGIIHESMEINVSDYSIDKDKKLTVNKFEFEALCLLGENVEPCFENASVQVYSQELKEQFKAQFIKMFDDLKELNTERRNTLDKTDILKKFNMKAEDLNFSIDELSAEELNEKLERLNTTPTTSNFSATYENKRKAIQSLFKDLYEYDTTGKLIKEVYYYVNDFDDKYAYVNESIYTKDEYISKKYRYGYTFDDNACTATLTDVKEEVFVRWLTPAEIEALDKLEENYQLYKNSHTYSNDEYLELEQYKLNSEKEKQEAVLDEVLAQYSKEIGDKQEFVELTNKKMEFTVDSLNKECIYIRGLYSTPNQPDKKHLLFSVDNSTKKKINKDDRYGDLFDRFKPSEAE